jgi:predicted transcriptional regulator of viral defense system
MSEKYTLKESVFRAFLKDTSLGPSEMTKLLGVKYNSVKAVYAKLCEDGLLTRVGRGNYAANVPGVLLHLMDRVEDLEKGRK